MQITTTIIRVSYRGGGGPGIPPQNLEIEHGHFCSPINISFLVLHVTGHKYVSSKCFFGKFVPDCVRSNLRGSKFKIFLGGMPPDPHTHMRALLSSYYHHVPPPTQKKKTLKILRLIARPCSTHTSCYTVTRLKRKYMKHCNHCSSLTLTAVTSYVLYFISRLTRYIILICTIIQ